MNRIPDVVFLLLCGIVVTLFGTGISMLSRAQISPRNPEYRNLGWKNELLAEEIKNLKKSRIAPETRLRSTAGSGSRHAAEIEKIKRSIERDRQLRDSLVVKLAALRQNVQSRQINVWNSSGVR